MQLILIFIIVFLGNNLALARLTNNVGLTSPTLGLGLGSPTLGLGLGSPTLGLGLTPSLGLSLTPSIKDLTIKRNTLGLGGAGGIGGIDTFQLCRSQTIPPTSWTVLQHKLCASFCINQPAPNIGGRCSADGVCTCTVLT